MVSAKVNRAFPVTCSSYLFASEVTVERTGLCFHLFYATEVSMETPLNI